MVELMPLKEPPPRRITHLAWTAKEIDYVQDNAHLLSAAHMALTLGRSRGSVIGRINRTEGVNLRTAEQAREADRPEPKPKIVRVTVAKPPKPEPRPKAVVERPALVALAPPPVIPPPPPLAPPRGVGIADLEPCHCRWPIGEPGGEFLYCGKQRVDTRYCAEHKKISSLKPARNPAGGPQTVLWKPGRLAVRNFHVNGV